DRRLGGRRLALARPGDVEDRRGALEARSGRAGRREGSGHRPRRVPRRRARRQDHRAGQRSGRDAQGGRRLAGDRQPLGRALGQALRERHGQPRAGHVRSRVDRDRLERGRPRDHDPPRLPLLLGAESARGGWPLVYKVPKFNGPTAEQWAAADRHDVYDTLDRMLTPTSAGGRNWRSSMGQDVTKGRATEIDYMNGYVVAQGRERGVPTPVSAATVDIVREVDAGTRKPEAQNIGLVLQRAGV